MRFWSLLFGIFMIGLVSAGSSTEIHYTGFEADNSFPLDGWINGGTDCKESSGAGFSFVDDSGVAGGTDSIEVQDDSASSYTAQTFDLSAPCGGGVCDTIDLSMYLYPNSFDNANEGFDIWCDYGTGTAVEVADWKDVTDTERTICGTIVQEDTWTRIECDISSVCTIDSAVEIRITSQDSPTGGNQDQVYIDGINITGYVNVAPIIANVTGSHSIIRGGDVITVYANTTSNGVNDTDLVDTVYLYCDNTTTPTAANTDCTGGINFDASYPYDLSCTFATATDDAPYTEYCRLYDGSEYSSIVPNITYTTDSSPPSLVIDSVAGDTVASYYDTADDAVTEINVTGETSMACRWSASDLGYSAMGNICVIDGTTASCNINDVASQGFYTRYISCQDSLANENNATNNLDASFTLDYSAPTTSDNSISAVQVPNYTVTISEVDNVDADPTTLYCTDSIGTCIPNLIIDHLGIITFTSSDRGLNFLRYNSTDDAGNVQTIQNKTININQLPVLTSVSDNATTIGGGELVNISSFSSDENVHDVTLWICNSTSISSSGCEDLEYCNVTGSDNVTCVFTSEIDSASHTWYAFLYDDLGEIAVSNFSGSYTTDSISPVITLVSPTNGSNITQSSVTITASMSEALSSAWYSLDGGVINVTMTNTTLLSYTHTNSSIADGTYFLTFWANDSYGNLGTLTGNSFTIDTTPVDTTAPAVTIVSPVNLSYQDPSSTLINITADEDLSWAGYSLNGGAVLDLGNSSLRSWNITLTSLTQETNYSLVIYANDTSSNQGNKTSVFYADSLAPRYSSAQADPSPANVSQDVNCSISWTDTYSITSVIIGENHTGAFENHSISFSGNSGIASYVIPGAQLGSPDGYTCRFHASDLAGNYNTTSVDFDVNDVTAPIVSVLSPANLTYSDENVSASIAVSENASLAWYSLNGVANVSMTNTSLIAWNSTLTSLSNGEYNITFYANDSSGNIGVSAIVYFSVNVTAPDTVPPVITINTISNATYYTATSLALNITSDEGLTWAGYSLNGSAIVNMTNTSTVDWNATLTLSSESTNTLIVYANDTSGNQGNKTILFYVDDVAPVYTNVSASPDPANESQDVTCDAYVADAFGLTGIKIEENSTGSFVNHTISLTETGWMNYTIGSVSRGEYTCKFHATDAAGNYNTTSVDFSVNDVTAPVVAINSPLNQTYGTANILFSVTLDESATAVNYSLNGASNVSLSGSGTAWSDVVATGVDEVKTVVFYAVDSSGNIGSNSVVFTVDATPADTTSPTITVWSPSNNSYDVDGSVLLNTTMSENIDWAGYTNNSGTLTNLGNTSLTSWNTTVTLSEGRHNITFYANDSSDNQGNSSVIVYVDLNNPSITNFSCLDANDSEDVVCAIAASDAVGLSSFKVSYNASGSWTNSSLISFTGTSNEVNYTISSGNYSPIGFRTQLYVYDLAGRINGTSVDDIIISDDTSPVVDSYTYNPNTTDELDPGVVVNVNATVTEDYNISVVYFMYKNSSAADWTLVEMSNNSVLVDGSESTVVYNASFAPQAENWTFRINATDYVGNGNVSSNVTIAVENDISEDISMSIPTIKSFILAQTADNNTVGRLIMNNTGDGNLSFNVSLVGDSDLASRLSVNYTGNLTYNYTGVASGSAVNISLEVNTTDLDAGLYAYNISVVSEVGTNIYERYVSIQSSVTPLLFVSIETYSSTVTLGQGNLELVAEVTNLGTSDATGVYLNWTLPSGFTLVSGSLNRSLGNLGVGVSGANTIGVNVGSSISESSVDLIAVATSSNADSVNDTKLVTIGNPLVVIETVTVSSGGGGGGGSSSSGGGDDKAISYSKVIEIVRGRQDSFDIDVENIYLNSTLDNLTLTLSGFLSKYIEVSPLVVNDINFRDFGKFGVSIEVPSYKEDYEEHELVAVIRGNLLRNGVSRNYVETQNILLIIQEASFEEVNIFLEDAERAVSEMRDAGFNIALAENILIDANVKLNEKRNGEALILGKSILEMRDLAFETQVLIDGVFESLRNPVKIGVITGNAVKDAYRDDSIRAGMNSMFTGWAIFGDKSVEEVLSLAKVAFDRGDYSLASSRVKEAQNLLLLNRKGNFGLFLFLYWPFIFLGIFFVSFGGVFGYRKHQRNVASSRVVDINREEKNIRKLLTASQKKYFIGSISSGEYHRIMNQHEKRLANLKTARLTLRNRRIEILKPRQVVLELDAEKTQTEREIKQLQTDFYKNKKIGKDSYELQFGILNERLAEIEGERMTVLLTENKSKKISAKYEKEKEGVPKIKDKSENKVDLKKKVKKDAVRKKIFFKKGIRDRRVKIKVGKNEK